MSKRIEIDGLFYRMRRGKLVEIPAEWLGNITTSKTKRKRKSDAFELKKERKRRCRLIPDKEICDYT